MNDKKDKLTNKKKRMEKMVKKFQEYVASYSRQPLYKTYSDETFLNDMLYGIGVTFSNKFEFRDGLFYWKKVLKNFIETDELYLERK